VNIRPEIMAVDSSTIDPHTAREVAAAAAKQDNPMVEVPVSGGTGGAEAGTLTFAVHKPPPSNRIAGRMDRTPSLPSSRGKEGLYAYSFFNALRASSRLS